MIQREHIARDYASVDTEGYLSFIAGNMKLKREHTHQKKRSGIFISDWWITRC